MGLINDMITKTKILKHSDISESEVLEVCSLKAIRWNYSLEEHRKWMKVNIKDEDYHILIKDDNKLIAYANLVNTTALINRKLTNFKGIGNVCTIESGVGYGNILMNAINKGLDENNWSGILLCKDDLIKYYKKFDWTLIKEADMKFKNKNGINYMIYNYKLDLNNFEFNGENF